MRSLIDPKRHPPTDTLRVRVRRRRGRQFAEDGSFGVENRTLRRGGTSLKFSEQPHVSYLAEDYDTNLKLVKYKFHPAVLPSLPKEDAHWNFARWAAPRGTRGG